jgi:Uma2 family endonuclease
VSTATRVMTAAELEQLPGNGMRHELVRGELRTMPPAGGEHGAVVVNLTGPLSLHVRRNQLGVVLGAETGFLIATNPDTVRAPDIGFVRRERIPASGIPRSFWPGPPDLAVEIVSPGDTVYEVDDKVLDWLEAGTSVVWVVNPRRRTVIVHRSLTDIQFLTEKDELDGDPVVAGFRCRVREIFV